nr:cingulin-like protein 1 [Solanum lycopersicum]
MAKKKTTPQDNQPQNPTEVVKENQVKENNHSIAMEEASEKLENLKNLNSMLLKETIEKRQQVDSLVQAKGCLESELKRSNSEKSELQTELTQLSEQVVRLEIEKKLVSVFVAVQIGYHAEVIESERNGFREQNDVVEKKLKSVEVEMRDVLREKGEIEKLLTEKESEIENLRKQLNAVADEVAHERNVLEGIRKEKDEIKMKLDAQIEEADGLRVRLVETEKREKEIEGEVGKLRVEYDALTEKIKDRESKIQSMVREKELVANSLLGSNKVIEELRGQIDGIVREKEGIEVERNAEMKKNGELQNTVAGLDDMVLSLQKEEAKLRENLAGLEKKCLEGLRKEEEMEKRINELVKGNNEKDIRVENLIEEKALVEKELDKALKQLDVEKKKVEQTVTAKNEMEEAKVGRETEIVELQKQLAEFKNSISELEVSCNGQNEKVKNLESEVGKYKAAFGRVTLEKDERQKRFVDEEQNGINMKKQIEEMEDHIQKIVKEVEQTKADYLNAVREKKELETQCQVLNKEIAFAQTSLGETEKKISDMQCKVELANSNSEEILNALRTAAGSIRSDGEGESGSVVGEKQMNGEDVKPYEAELEAITNAIKSKENKVEEMQRQVEFLQFSVAQAQNKKNFWTMLSSATTLFAAISLAYVARGH